MRDRKYNFIQYNNCNLRYWWFTIINIIKFIEYLRSELICSKIASKYHLFSSSWKNYKNRLDGNSKLTSLSLAPFLRSSAQWSGESIISLRRNYVLDGLDEHVQLCGFRRQFQRRYLHNSCVNNIYRSFARNPGPLKAIVSPARWHRKRSATNEKSSPTQDHRFN